MLLAQLDLTDKDINPVAKFTNVASIVNLIVPILMGGAALVFLGILLMGGYTFMTAAGDAERVKQAQKQFKYALFGFVTVLIAYLIVRIIEQIFKIKVFL